VDANDITTSGPLMEAYSYLVVLQADRSS